MNKKPIIKRFLEKIIKTPTCWIWTGATRGKKVDYGNLRFGKKRILAHRISWELHYGKIPKGKLVLHKCDFSLCVNPKHLFIGTQLDNMRDREQKGRTPLGPFPNPKTKTITPVPS